MVSALAGQLAARTAAAIGVMRNVAGRRGESRARFMGILNHDPRKPYIKRKVNKRKRGRGCAAGGQPFCGFGMMMMGSDADSVSGSGGFVASAFTAFAA